MKPEDPYLWMENLNNSRLIKWIDEENTRFKVFIGSYPDLVIDRVKKYYLMPYIYYIKPSKRGYYILVREGSSYKIKLLYRDGSLDNVIDSRKLGKNIILQWFYITEDGDKLAYSYSYAGSDEGTLKIVEVDSRELIDELNVVISNLIWIDEGKYYYIRSYRKGKTPDGVDAPAERIFLREDYKNDYLVFGEGLETSHFISFKKSVSGRIMMVTVSYGWNWSNLYGGDINDPSDWRLIYGESNYIVKPINYLNGKYYLLSYDDRDGLGRVIEADNSPKIIIDAGSYPIRNGEILGDKIVLYYIINAASRLKIYGLKGEFIKEIYIDPPGTLSNFNRFENELIFKYESFYIPYRVYKLDGWNLKLHILDEERVPDNYIIEDRWVKSYDGTSIHFFIFRKGDAELKNVIAYGYGGFGLGLTPRFYPHIIPLIEDGFVFTVANIRGGDEFGESWHKAGMRSNKNNVFKDFIAVIQYFKDMGSKVVAYGSSNGGLLVGGVLTIDPSLLDGAVIGYPVLDMLRFHKLYIGRAWIPEYGDPENPEDLEYLIKYSPYHNIREMGYPPTLVYTGLYDDRVHPSHAFKFVAKLKDHNAPVYLRTEKLSGHMGASPEVKVRELSEVVSFIYKVFESRAKDKE